LHQQEDIVWYFCYCQLQVKRFTEVQGQVVDLIPFGILVSYSVYVLEKISAVVFQLAKLFLIKYYEVK
jgi:hypothetical protein